MVATFYKFKKRINGTSTPESGGTDFTITLKDSCSITAPVITLSSSAIEYNYCYIEDFSRYYFVTSCVIIHTDLIQYTLAVDVLGSHFDSFKDNSFYVLRSASDYSAYIPDDAWTHTTAFSESVTTADLFDTYFTELGCYVVSIVNADDTVTINPSSKCYAMTRTELLNLFSLLFDLDNYDNIDDTTATFFNPMQYVINVRWYPLAISAVSSNADEYVSLGWYDFSDSDSRPSGRPVTEFGTTFSTSLTIGSYSDWTDRDAAWTRYALYVPSCGITEVDPAFSGQTLTLKMDIDFNTGRTFVVGTTGTNQIAFQLSGELGASVQVNQVAGELQKVDVGKTALAAVGAITRNSSTAQEAVTSYMTGSALASAAAWSTGETASQLRELGVQATQASLNQGKEVASSVMDAVKNSILNPTVSSTGSDGARYTINQNHTVILYRRHYNPRVSISDLAAKIGGMCHMVTTLEDLSGYTVVANGSTTLNATAEEKNAICTMLENGIYIN